MPLREEKKVLSTVKPWSPAAAPSSGGQSRRSRALSISAGPTRHSPPPPPAPEGKREDRNLAGWGSRQQQESSARNLQVRGAGLPWGCQGEAPRLELHPAAQSAPCSSRASPAGGARVGEGPTEGAWSALSLLGSQPIPSREEEVGRTRPAEEPEGSWETRLDQETPKDLSLKKSVSPHP